MDGWDKFYKCVLKETIRLTRQKLERFEESLGDWLYGQLNWPSDDWERQLELLVEHTRYYGLLIEPECIAALHALIEARVNQSGPFAVLADGATGTIQVAVGVTVDDGTRTDAAHSDANVAQEVDQSAAVGESADTTDAEKDESSGSGRPFIISVIPDISGPPRRKKPKTVSTSKKASSPPQIETKPRLPANSRGTWSGRKGGSVFRYNDSAQNRAAGIAGKKVRYRNQHIAVGGFPAEAYYGGNAPSASVEIEKVRGTITDSTAADRAMRKKLGNPNWQRPEGYRWHHAGGVGSKVMELVQHRYHTTVAHKGPAAIPRAEGRAATEARRRAVDRAKRRSKSKRRKVKARASSRAGSRAARSRGSIGKGAVGRGIAVVDVYLTARDALRGFWNRTMRSSASSPTTLSAPMGRSLSCDRLDGSGVQGASL